MGDLIELRHLGGERKIVSIAGVTYRRIGLEIYWGPLCGTYTLDLKRNQLLRAPAWGAVDVDQAWQVWRRLTGKGFAVVKPGVKLHCLLCQGVGWHGGKPCTLCVKSTASKG